MMGDYTIGVLVGNLLFAICVVLLFFVCGWVTALIWKRLDIADAWWGLGFIVVSWALIGPILLESTSLSKNMEERLLHQIVTLCIVSLWGIRLFSHIARRLWSHTEDKRYIEMRSRWKGNTAVQSLLRVFLLQGALCVLVAFPIIATSSSRYSASWLGIACIFAGAALWLFGFVYETVADVQLKRFLVAPHAPGALMTQGLWATSRHPNYFGEVVQWWGVWVIACSALIPTYVIFGLVGPVVITLLITKVSGIPMTEKKYRGRPAFEAYAAVTPPLVPRFLNIPWRRQKRRGGSA